MSRSLTETRLETHTKEISVLHVAIFRRGIRIRSFSLCEDRSFRGQSPPLRFAPTFLALWVLAFTGSRVLGKELDSQFGHLFRIIPLIFWINVFQFEFLVSERGELWDKALPCV
jgi:hypothetical protein